MSQKTLDSLQKENTGKFPRKKRFLDNISKSLAIANTIRTAPKRDAVDTYIKTDVKDGVGKIDLGSKQYSLRILTPIECWRLMGFDDVLFNKAKRVCSDTQLYKQAGNSIVVDVIEQILDNLIPREMR